MPFTVKIPFEYEASVIFASSSSTLFLLEETPFEYETSVIFANSSSTLFLLEGIISHIATIATTTIVTTKVAFFFVAFSSVSLRLRSTFAFSFAAFSSVSLRLRPVPVASGNTTVSCVSSLLRLLMNSATLWVRSWRPFIAIAMAEITGREICFACNSATGSPSS